jgi:hypothetical protein
MKVTLTVCEDVVANEDGSFTPIRPLPEGHAFDVPPPGESLPCYLVITVVTGHAAHHCGRDAKLAVVGPDRRPLAPPKRVHLAHRHGPAEGGEVRMHACEPARFPVRSPGGYEVRVSVDGSAVASHVLVVREPESR